MFRWCEDFRQTWKLIGGIWSHRRLFASSQAFSASAGLQPEWPTSLSLFGTVLNKCSPTSRTMSPGSVWYLLVPLVGIVWNFFVVSALANSLGNEFRLRGTPTAESKPGKPVGIAMAICGALIIVPLLNIMIALPALILWIAYWVKIAGYSRQLNLPAASSSGPCQSRRETQPWRTQKSPPAEASGLFTYQRSFIVRAKP